MYKKHRFIKKGQHLARSAKDVQKASLPKKRTTSRQDGLSKNAKIVQKKGNVKASECNRFNLSISMMITYNYRRDFLM